MIDAIETWTVDKQKAGYALLYQHQRFDIVSLQHQPVIDKIESMAISPKQAALQKIQIAGWIIFIGSAICFMVSAWQNRDTAGFMGSLLFFLACFVFLWPLIEQQRR
ncbi:MAG: hypothetical protein ACFBSG_21230 [Leptolyngbyaceae cyanobacterium]